MDYFESFLEKRRVEGNFRYLEQVDRLEDGSLLINNKRLIDFSSNNYLGLLMDKRLKAACAAFSFIYGTGSGASRLMSGDLRIHHELEYESANLVGKEDALLFGSGFLANLGIISSFVGREDAVFVDKLAHASIIDACLLSRAKLFRFKHNDLDHLTWLLKRNVKSFRRILIVTESIFSMDGDICPLSELINIKKTFNAYLMVDEAHSIGVIGEKGCGLSKHLGMERYVDIIMGTYGKSFAGYGAFVATNQKLKSFFINSARSFIFSTALPPSVIGTNLTALYISQKEQWRRKKTLANSKILRQMLEKHGIKTIGNKHIVPILIGDEKLCVKISFKLREKGLFVKAIRHPTVPKGASRLRVSICAYHSYKDIKKLVNAIKNI